MTLGLALTVLCGPASAAAQRLLVDAGTFTITEGGRVIGREQFSITRAAAGAGWALELRADAVHGDTTVSWRLQVDSMGRPISARRERRVAGAIDARATGAQARGRFATLWRDASREAAREHRLTAATRVVDPLVIHPWTLAVAALERDSVVELVTLEGGPAGDGRAGAPVGRDTLRIGGQAVAARRAELVVAARTVRLWADTLGRVLAVEWPAVGRRAQRDDPPPPGPP